METYNFIPDTHQRQSMRDAHTFIEKENLWDFFDQSPPLNTGYYFWDHPTLAKISNGVESSGHSGASFSLMMRDFRHIKRYGMHSFTNLFPR